MTLQKDLFSHPFDSLQGPDMDSRSSNSEQPSSFSQPTNDDDSDNDDDQDDNNDDQDDNNDDIGNDGIASSIEPIFFIPLESPVPATLQRSYSAFNDFHYGENRYGSGSYEHFASPPQLHLPHHEKANACNFDNTCEQIPLHSIILHQLPCYQVHSLLPTFPHFYQPSYFLHASPCVQPFISPVHQAHVLQQTAGSSSNVQTHAAAEIDLNLGPRDSVMTAPTDHPIAQYDSQMYTIHPSIVSSSFSGVGNDNPYAPVLPMTSYAGAMIAPLIAPSLAEPSESLEQQQQNHNPMPRPHCCPQQQQNPLIVATTITGETVQVPYATFLESQIHLLRQQQLLNLQEMQALQTRSNSLSSPALADLITSQPLPVSAVSATVASVASVADYLPNQSKEM